MSDSAVLLALAERCEKAESRDAEIDTLIYAAVNGWRTEWRGNSLVRLTDFYPIGTIDPGERNRWFSGHIGAPAYTASLDAAMTLVPEGMIWGAVNSTLAKPEKAERGTGFVGKPGQTTNEASQSEAATPALALCAAALRARAAAMEPTEEPAS